MIKFRQDLNIGPSVPFRLNEFRDKRERKKNEKKKANLQGTNSVQQIGSETWRD